MLYNFKQYDSLAFIFMIPNVSHLLIYKDNWNKSKVMRQVISEMLSNGLFSKLYLGSKPEKFIPEEPALNDCAIVSIKIDGINRIDYNPKNIAELFATEICKEANALQFDNEMVDEEHNVSSIGINVNVSIPGRKPKSTQAA
jgi:hypothetical protein